MAGNVWEWVADAYAPYPTDERQDAGSTAEGPTRVIRGGAWNGTIASWVRTTIRYTNVPTARSHAIGFRCAKPL